MRTLLLLLTTLLLGSGCLTPRALQESINHKEMGLAYLGEGNDALAVTELKKSVKKNRWDHEAWQALGLAYFATGHLADAEESLLTAVELEEDFSQARMNLGSLYLAMERWDDAIASLDLVLLDAEYREPARVRHNLGWAHYNKGEYGPARQSYRDVLRKYPMFCPSLLGLGYVDEAEGQLDDALARYRQAVECDPRDLRSLTSLGIVEARMDLVSDACQHLGTVQQGDPYGELKDRADEVLRMLDCDSVSEL